METIALTAEDGQEEQFYVIADTRINGSNYLLVCDSLDEDGEAFILKDVSEESDEESIYVGIEDENEFNAVAKFFQEDLEDIDLV